MIKVCWISNIPSPYKVDFMNMLGKRISLTCVFEKKEEEGREKEWYNNSFEFFDAFYLHGNKQDKQLIQSLANQCDVLINSDYSSKICIYSTKVFKKNLKPVIMQADGGLAISRGPLDLVIRYVMNQCDFFLSSGSEVNKYFEYYKVPSKKILNYHFSSLTKNDLEKNKILRHNKYALKEKCGYKEDTILFSVGQQIPRKGYDILVEAMINVPRHVGLYIAGGEPEENVKDIIEKNHLDNIHFIGFKSKNELSNYYAAADIFILPTRYDIWGLVINEAMSFGLPIISTNKCVAAMEFNNWFKNGLIVETNNVEEIENAIVKLSNDSNLIDQLGRNSLEGIKEYSLENMCDDYLNAINRVLEEQK